MLKLNNVNQKTVSGSNLENCFKSALAVQIQILNSGGGGKS